MFCDNVECSLHLFEDNEGGRITLRKPLKDIEVRNYLYKNSEGKEFNLCQRCHAAIEMVTVKP